jgi:RNA-directed DNA polymerase
LSGSTLSGLAQGINAQVRGWVNYYGTFYRSELYSLAMRINEHRVRSMANVEVQAIEGSTEKNMGLA